MKEANEPIRLKVGGMSCAACVARVERAARSVPGVDTCTVSLLTGSLQATGSATPDAIAAAVRDAGYTAEIRAGEGPERPEDFENAADVRRRFHRLWLSLILLVPLTVVAMGPMAGLPVPSPLQAHTPAGALLQAVLSTVILALNGFFFRSGLRALARFSPNMDSLVALGSGTAWVWSMFLLILNFTPGGIPVSLHVSGGCSGAFAFDSAAMIVTLVSAGKALEARAKGRTTSALAALARLTPQMATRVNPDGSETEVPAASLQVGDRFRLRPGDVVPVDGTILEGASALDESMLTGESIPAEKETGGTVYAATRNGNGTLLCRADTVGPDTTLARILRLVEDSAATKAPIARMADKAAGIFVPIVIAVALLTFTVWLALGSGLDGALTRAIAVLVISCPCALGLATPVATVTGSGTAARHHILFKNAAALEMAGRVRVVALDKTGTLTKGEPAVTDVAPVPESGLRREDLLALAATLEAGSEHPIARAIRAAAPAPRAAAAVRNFRALPGAGIEAELDGHRCLVCNRQHAEKAGALSREWTDQAATLSSAGKTPLFVLRDGALLGLIAVADTLKEDAVAAVRAMREAGLRVVMLTGDNERTAHAIARTAGVDEVRAGLFPAAKAEALQVLHRIGPTAMVGDGINDAPALALADCGFAIGAGTDVAIESASVILVKNRLSDLADALRLGRATLRIIRENLFWALIYNILLIPLAAGVYTALLGWTMHPALGAAAMGLSSVCVVSNALRLNRFRFSAPAEAPAAATPRTPRCYAPATAEQPENRLPDMTKTLLIQGMMCPRCEAHVQKALTAVDGVLEATADHKAGTATVTLAKEVSEADLKAAVLDAGYEYLGLR